MFPLRNNLSLASHLDAGSRGNPRRTEWPLSIHKNIGGIRLFARASKPIRKPQVCWGRIGLNVELPDSRCRSLEFHEMLILAGALIIVQRGNERKFSRADSGGMSISNWRGAPSFGRLQEKSAIEERERGDYFTWQRSERPETLRTSIAPRRRHTRPSTSHFESKRLTEDAVIAIICASDSCVRWISTWPSTLSPI